MMDQHTMNMMMGMMSVIGVIALIGTAIYIIPFWFIFKKAGFSPWLCLLLLLPVVNLVMLYVLAFTDWKVVPVAPAPIYVQPRA
ncbi:MAG TPA: hypothetical protein VHE33_17150 [Acidobacteriaceae bacterium]|nr:hypothetical protein [Acidobacteriaceae bacterium]